MNPTNVIPNKFGAGQSPTNGNWTLANNPRFLADLTGDKRADIIGFANQNVLVCLNNGDGTFAPPLIVLSNVFCSDQNSGSWRGRQNPRHVVDLNGDRRADILGFGYQGVWISINDGTGKAFAKPYLGIPFFGEEAGAGGWTTNHVRTFADVTGDGRLDIVGFYEDGVYVAVNDGAASPKFAAAVKVRPEFGNKLGSGGWSNASHVRLMADIDGDGRADIVGFKSDGIYVSRNKGGLVFGAPEKALGVFGGSASAGGWDLSKNLLMACDMTGDGRADIVVFGENAVWIARNYGDGTFAEPKPVVAGLANAQGFKPEKHSRYLADMTGSGRPDIIGFADDGLWLSKNNGDDTFSTPQHVSQGFSSPNWDEAKHIRTVADVSGDGRVDAVGFGEDGVWIGRS